MLAVHGRTRTDRFIGQAEYDTIADIVSRVRIPVLANGDIDSTAKAQHVLAHTGAAGIMIGRAAQGRPWLPGFIARQLAGKPATAPSHREQVCILMGHVARLHEFYGATSGSHIARKHTGWTIDALLSNRDARAAKAAFNSLDASTEQLLWLEQFARADQKHAA